MPETIDTLQVDLIANVAPLMEQIAAGLQRVRDQVQTLKGFARVDLTASMDGLLGTLNEAKGRVSSWKTEVNKQATLTPSVQTTGITGALSSLRASVGSVVGAFAGLNLAIGGMKQAIEPLRKMVEASNAQEAALARLQQAVANNSQATEGMFERLEAQAQDLAKTLGQAGDEELESAQAMLAGFNLTEEQILKFTPAILDMAVGLQKTTGAERDLENLAKLVGKAMTGQTESLGRMGVMIDETRAKTDPLGAALAGLSRYTGQAAAAAQTGAGRLKSFQDRVNELQEAGGKLIKAVLTPFLTVLTPLINAFLSLPAPVQAAAAALVILNVTLVATNTTLTAAIAKMILFIDTTSAGAVAAVTKLGAALVTMNFAAFTSGIAASAGALKMMVLQMGTAGQAALALAAAVAVGYAIGWGLDQIAKLPPAYREWTLAELDAQAAHIKQKHGLDLTLDAMRVFLQLSPEVRHELIEQAKAAGRTAIAVQELARALEQQKAAQEQASLTTFYEDQKKQLADFISYYSHSRAWQLAEDIARTKQQIDAVKKGSDEEKSLQVKLTSLYQQVAQEHVRQQEDAARKGTDALKKAFDERKKKVDDFFQGLADKVKTATERWKEFSQEIAMDTLRSMDPREADRSGVRQEAEAERQNVAATVMREQEKAEAIIRINEWEKMRLEQIDAEYRSKEGEKRAAYQQQLDQESQEALNRRQTEYQTQLQQMMDPVQAYLASLATKMDPVLSAWGQRIAGALQPLGQAFTSFLMGTKVKWSDTFKQMAATFVSQFVQKIIAGILRTVMVWIFGEKAKQGASMVTTKVVTMQSLIQEYKEYRAAGASIMGAIAKIFNAHSSIPWVGVAIALGLIAVMMAAFSSFKSKAKAMAVGGLIDKPTMALMGEEGPELVAPVEDFRTVAARLMASTLDTVRMAAREVVAPGGPRLALAEAGGAGGGGDRHIYFQGWSLIDTGELVNRRRVVREIQRAEAEEKDLEL